MPVKGQRLERGDATRALLLEVARSMFGARGYAATSLDDVVAAAGVTKGALYHHFRNKEQLFRAVADVVKRDTTAQLSDIFLFPDPVESLVAGCTAMLDAYLEPSTRQIVWLDAPAVLDPAEYRELQARYEPVFLRAALRRAMRTGHVDELPLRALASMLVGAVGEACGYVASAAEPSVARADVLRTLARLIQGLRSPTGQPPDGHGPASR